MLSDDHAAVDDPHHGTAATGPVHVAGEPGCSQVGDGHRTGVGCTEIVYRSGVMRLIERPRTEGYSDHGVPGSLVGDWRCRAEGFPMDWSQCAS